VFRKASRRAGRAARSVLPPSVPAELVCSAPRFSLLDLDFSWKLASRRNGARISRYWVLIWCCPCVCR
jgi:hypothetical protein